MSSKEDKKQYRKKVKSAIRRLTALNHPDQRQILRSITEEPKTVTELKNELGLEQSVTSWHLAKLRESMLVKWERQGQHIFYSADIEEIERCNEAVLEFLDS